MPNTITDLRSHLFETLAALKDKDAPLDLDRARAVASVAKVIVETAKVEVQYLQVTGGAHGTGFLPEIPPKPDHEPRRIAPAPSAPVAAATTRPAETCVLCGVRLTTPHWIERGICGSCSERPEATANRVPAARKSA